MKSHISLSHRVIVPVPASPVAFLPFFYQALQHMTKFTVHPEGVAVNTQVTVMYLPQHVLTPTRQNRGQKFLLAKWAAA